MLYRVVIGGIGRGHMWKQKKKGNTTIMRAIVAILKNNRKIRKKR